MTAVRDEWQRRRWAERGGETVAVGAGGAALGRDSSAVQRCRAAVSVRLISSWLRLRAALTDRLQCGSVQHSTAGDPIRSDRRQRQPCSALRCDAADVPVCRPAPRRPLSLFLSSAAVDLRVECEAMRPPTAHADRLADRMAAAKADREAAALRRPSRIVPLVTAHSTLPSLRRAACLRSRRPAAVCRRLRGGRCGA